ncbi:ExeM/NucH family extracellular endonuclease [Vibrio sp. SS-MA-C1-2]|uniref:ExeM/NucH family extracellular endonuclease n=1 Tax=Vibrio sp. SS-MA-C1-2 TaxID=2908646 RepID=UPI0028831C30|nr:ExeM/NucH family extracellular endonuclease [Vibrio sp. SS-MA-C1-2]
MSNGISRTLLALTIGGVFTAPAYADVIISQYIEGASYNKAIEIVNTGDEAVSLDNFILAKSANGNGEWGAQRSLTGITLGAQEVLVLSHKDANAQIQAITDITDSHVINFNGDDPIALLNSDGSVHDIIGEMGDVNFAQDQTLIKFSDQMTPSSVYNKSQWSTLEKDSLEGLGSPEGAEPVEPFSCLVNGTTPQFTTIQEIQGEGKTSPFISGYPYITEEEYYVKGVVTAVTTGISKGFYLHALVDDQNNQTSEGLFVNTSQTDDISAGDVVCVKGNIQEYYDNTQLKASTGNTLVQSQQAVPQAETIILKPSDESFSDTLERYEGMLVATDKALDLRITRTFGYDYDGRRNNLVVAQGEVNLQPNQIYVANSEQSHAQRQKNAEQRLFVETDQKAADGTVPFYPNFGRTDADQNGTTEDVLRINDTITGLEGVINYSYNEYRLITTNTITRDDIISNSPRTESPAEKQGDLRVATFNVLNYFNSPFGGDQNPLNQNRGANNLEEFERQQAKIVSAIVKLDADIIGLMEIENNGFGDGSAIKQLVEQINAKINSKKDQYQYISVDSNQDGQFDELDSVGTDAISVGVIYRVKSVKLIESQVIEMPRQQAPTVYDDSGDEIESGLNYQRDTLAPTFKIKGGNDKEPSEYLTVAVNHLKSKGSKCWEDAAPIDQGGQNQQDLDYQGSCENFRVAGVVALGEALNHIDEQQKKNQVHHTIILGDLNAYGQEDPLLILTDYSKDKYQKEIRAARDTYIGDKIQYGEEGAVINQNFGYINAVSKLHPVGWSYSYDDEVGSLDHILISPTLESKLVNATEWHINAAESTLFDYNGEYKGDFPHYLDHYRSSDHDPAIVDLNIYHNQKGNH